MPASTTRTCPTCNKVKFIAEFRDTGDVTFGRPPKFCAECRANSEQLQARQAANRSYRATAVAQQRGYANRTPEDAARDQAYSHPDGLKTCPELSGCGQTLPLDQFYADRYQFDGLAPQCWCCVEDARALYA